MGAARIILLAVLCALGLAGTALAAFPGQNGKIAFAGDPNPNGSFLRPYTINPDGTAVTQLSPSSGLAPAWSPDGQRIAFVTLREGAPEIWAMNADGSGEVRLTPDNTYNHADPTWTPDGTKILWSNDFFGTYDIWKMNPDGSGQTKVGGSDTENDTAPAVSPDGTKIAFVRSGQEVWAMDSDGTNEHKLADGIDPDWSPDGTKIAFTRFVYDLCSDDEVQVAENAEIFKMNADGTGVTRLTHGGAINCFTAIWDTLPAWSPDGTKIAWTSHTESFSTSIDPDHQVLIMTADGSFVSSLGNEPLKAEPDWQPVQPGYPRPKGATPFRASLVPAYIACASPNRTHGPPLAFASCSPPQQRSAVLTTGHARRERCGGEHGGLGQARGAARQPRHARRRGRRRSFDQRHGCALPRDERRLPRAVLCPTTRGACWRCLPACASRIA